MVAVDERELRFDSIKKMQIRLIFSILIIVYVADPELSWAQTIVDSDSIYLVCSGKDQKAYRDHTTQTENETRLISFSPSTNQVLYWDQSTLRVTAYKGCAVSADRVLCSVGDAHYLDGPITYSRGGEWIKIGRHDGSISTTYIESDSNQLIQYVHTFDGDCKPTTDPRKTDNKF